MDSRVAHASQRVARRCAHGAESLVRSRCACCGLQFARAARDRDVAVDIAGRKAERTCRNARRACGATRARCDLYSRLTSDPVSGEFRMNAKRRAFMIL